MWCSASRISIEVQPSRTGQSTCDLRNLEYDLTRSIKKVVYGFQSVDAVLAAMTEPVTLTVFITPDTLPEWLGGGPADHREGGGRHPARVPTASSPTTIIDPDAPDSPINRQELYERYGLQPIAVSLFSDQTYYLHMSCRSATRPNSSIPPAS